VTAVTGDSILRRYRRFFGADPRRDVDDELAFHIAMRVEEFRRMGMSAAEAEAAALARFGNFGGVRDECHELGRRRATRTQRALWLDALRQDVRYAVRSLAGNRGFAAMVVMTLALGIGATTAVFSVAYGVLLRPLPYRDADALVRLWSRNAERGLEFFSVSPADYVVWRAASQSFVAMAAFERQRDATVIRRAEPQSVEVAAVTPDIFPLLGVAALRGRSLVADDARDGAPPVAVLSHDLWAARFGSDDELVGGDLLIDGQRHTVVGVMPPRFAVPGTSAEIWRPLSLSGVSTDHANRYLRILARLKPGVSAEKARRELDVVAANIGRELPATNRSWSVNILSIPEWIVGTQFRRAVVALLGVVGFVLLIACANAANLQLARAAARRREIAVRAALGATRGRITGQLLAESVLLGLVAGVIGIGLARAGIDVLRAVGTETVPRLADVRLDGPVLAFTAGIALGTGILFGLLPALGATRADVSEVLTTGGRGQGQSLPGRWIRAALVVGQIALSLILLIGAGLLMRSFMRIQELDLGFDPTNIAAARVQLPDESYGDVGRTSAFITALVERARRLPGVSEAAAVSSPPFAGPNTGNVFVREDRPLPDRQHAPDADWRIVTPGYLRTIGIRLLRGRDFSTLDHSEAPGTILVSQATADRYWPGEDPIGRRIRVGDIVNGPTFTIVGVVGDARYIDRTAVDVRPMIYFSALARHARNMTLLVRGTSGGVVSAPAIRAVVASLDPALPPPAIASFETQVGNALATPRFAAVLFGIFAGTALLLAAIGVYGVMAYLVRRRTHEFGLRSALGASTRQLVLSVIGGALRLTAAGVAIGLFGAWILTQSIASLLFGVSPTDPVTFVSIALTLALVGLVASVLPARRAARADPLVALRGGS
jgi:predicted permease